MDDAAAELLLDPDMAQGVLSAASFRTFHRAAGVCRAWQAVWRFLWLRGYLGIPLAPRSIHGLSLEQLQGALAGIRNERVAEAVFNRARALLRKPESLDVQAWRAQAEAAAALIEHGVMDAVLLVAASPLGPPSSALQHALEFVDLLIMKVCMRDRAAEVRARLASARLSMCAALDNPELRSALAAWKSPVSYRALWTPHAANWSNPQMPATSLPADAVLTYVRCARRALRCSDSNKSLLRAVNIGLVYVAELWNHQEESLRPFQLSDGELFELQGRMLRAGYPALLVELLARVSPPYASPHDHATCIVFRNRIARVLARMAAREPALTTMAVPAVVQLMREHGADEEHEPWSSHVKQSYRGARKRVLLALVEAGGEPARELALVTGAHEEWLEREAPPAA